LLFAGLGDDGARAVGAIDDDVGFTGSGRAQRGRGSSTTIAKFCSNYVGKTARDLNEAHRKATGVVTRKRKDLEKAEAEWTEWTSAWQAALKALHLAATATPETTEAQINAIDDMRETADRRSRACRAPPHKIGLLAVIRRFS